MVIEQYVHKIDIVLFKLNEEVIVFLIDLVGSTINININEFDIRLNDDKDVVVLDEFFKGNYKIIEYYYGQVEVYTEFVWETISMYNIKENILYRYPFLLSKKEELKRDNKLEEKVRYAKLPLITATNQKHLTKYF